MFSGEVWFWRGPSPYHFVTVPEGESAELHALSALVSYGWGMVPVEARIGSTRWATSLWPKNGGYVVPLKDRVRKSRADRRGRHRDGAPGRRRMTAS